MEGNAPSSQLPIFASVSTTRYACHASVATIRYACLSTHHPLSHLGPPRYARPPSTPSLLCLLSLPQYLLPATLTSHPLPATSTPAFTHVLLHLAATPCPLSLPQHLLPATSVSILTSHHPLPQPCLPSPVSVYALLHLVVLVAPTCLLSCFSTYYPLLSPQ